MACCSYFSAALLPRCPPAILLPVPPPSSFVLPRPFPACPPRAECALASTRATSPARMVLCFIRSLRARAWAFAWVNCARGRLWAFKRATGKVITCARLPSSTTWAFRGGGAAVNCRPSAIFENASRKRLFARCGLSKASFPKLPLLLNVQEIVLETEGGRGRWRFCR